MRAQSRERAGFVPTHKAAVSRNIGGKDGREPAFDPLSAQRFLQGCDFLIEPPCG
jgi:hypothetical protein